MNDIYLDEIDKHIGNQLRLSRNNIGMTQKELADLTGVTFQQVQKYETGTNRIGGSRLYQFCKILEVEPNYFFAEIPYNENKVNIQNNNARNNDLNNLIKSYKNISSPELRNVVLGLAKMIAKRSKCKK